MLKNSIEDLLKDPAVPYWVKDMAKLALGKDPVDAASWLPTLSRIFDAREKKIHEDWTRVS